MSKPIPTAEDLLRQIVYITQDGDPESVHDSVTNVVEAMNRFAKLHVRAALEAAADNAQVSENLGNDSSEWVKKDSILNAYPSHNIQ